MPNFSGVPNLYLLTQCDMTCNFCYASKNLGAMSMENACLVLDQFKELGVERVNVTGGEVMLHPQALNIVEHASKIGLRTTLFTSGSLYNAVRVKAFSPLIEWLALSLDGDSLLNVEMGRTRSHFANTINAIGLTRQSAPKVRIRIATVVTRVNLNRLQLLAEILTQTPPDLWRLKQMVTTRLAGLNSSELGISDAEFVAAMQQMEAQYGHLIRMQILPASAKEGDTMCVHPNGDATITLRIDDAMRIVQLGNVFRNPDDVWRDWANSMNALNSAKYTAQWI